MNLVRAFFVGFFVWLLAKIVSNYLKRNAQKINGQNPSARIGTMVRCARCGLHVPEGEAYQKGELYYCSLQHRDNA